jgi:hypothetical protein
MHAILLAATVLCALVCVASSSAAPELTLSVRAGPVPGFGGTGDRAGAGARLYIDVGVKGTEYDGHPPPLESLDLTLPPGMRFDTTGFKRFLPSGFDKPHPGAGPGSLCLSGPPSCVPGVQIGPPTSGTAIVAFGGELVRETLTALSFDDSAGGISLAVFGREPALLEFFAKSSAPTGTAARGLTLRWSLPTVETVPGANEMSVTQLRLNLGSGMRHDGRSRFSLRMPAACRRESLRFSARASFSAVGDLPPRKSTATYRTGCPRGARERGTLALG